MIVDAQDCQGSWDSAPITGWTPHTISVHFHGCEEEDDDETFPANANRIRIKDPRPRKNTSYKLRRAIRDHMHTFLKDNYPAIWNAKDFPPDAKKKLEETNAPKFRKWLLSKATKDDTYRDAMMDFDREHQ